MKIFEFLKNAGASVFGGILPDKDKDGVEASKKLNEHLGKSGIPNRGIQVEYDPKGEVRVTGKAPTQAEKEKILLAVGNVKGVDRVVDHITVEAAEPEARFYTVKSGDTLGKIAKEMYGDSGDYPKIFEANKPLLSDPDKIYPGQMLRIPA